MNWTSDVDVAVGFAPPWLLRWIAWGILVAALLPGHPGITWLLLYAHAKGDATANQLIAVLGQLSSRQ